MSAPASPHSTASTGSWDEIDAGEVAAHTVTSPDRAADRPTGSDDDTDDFSGGGDGGSGGLIPGTMAQRRTDSEGGVPAGDWRRSWSATAAASS